MSEPPDPAAPLSAQIVIPTLRGPVSLISLIEEHGDHRSTVTLAETSQPTGIAAAYNSFVDYSTGVINRLFPKKLQTFYRIEVDGPIEAGNSFQLPVLVAHAMREDGNRLAALGAIGERPDAAPEPAAQLIWASGTIAPVTYAVGRVDDIGMKLVSSYPLFEGALDAGQTVRIFVPAANADQVTPDIALWLAEHRLAVEVVRWVDDVLKVLGLPPIPRAATPAPDLQWKGNPYRGLDAFTSEHSAIFFGRKLARAEAARLLRAAALAGRPFLLVHGPSGVGKSSLVRAGLVQDVAVGQGFRSLSFEPSGGLNSLHSILNLMAGTTDSEPPSPDAFLAWCEEIIPVIKARLPPESPRWMLVIDQLELLFAPGLSEETRDAFAHTVERLVQTGFIWVVATLRSDMLPSIDQLPPLSRLASSERTYRLAPPSPYDLLEIISAPAALAGRPFDHRVAEALAAQAARSPDSLPLLEALLYRLFELGGSPGDVAQSLEQLGGFDGAVRQWADSVHRELLALGFGEAALNRALAALVRIDPLTGALVSQTVSYRPETEVGAIHQRLVSDRLATTLEIGGIAQVRLVHDTLTTHWPLLARLGERLGAALSLRDELQADAARWRRSGGDRERLLRGAEPLSIAQALITDGLVDLSDEVSAFVSASVVAADAAALESRRLALAVRGRTQLLRAFRLLAAAALVALLGGIGFSYYLWMDGAVSRARVSLEASEMETARQLIEPVIDNPLLGLVPATPSLKEFATRLLDLPMVTKATEDQMWSLSNWVGTGYDPVPAAFSGYGDRVLGCDVRQFYCLTVRTGDAAGLLKRYRLLVQTPSGVAEDFDGVLEPPPTKNVETMDARGEWMAISEDNRLHVWRLPNVDVPSRGPLMTISMERTIDSLDFAAAGRSIFMKVGEEISRVDLEPRFEAVTGEAGRKLHDKLLKKSQDEPNNDDDDDITSGDLTPGLTAILKDPLIARLVATPHDENTYPLPFHLLSGGRLVATFDDPDCDYGESLLFADGGEKTGKPTALLFRCSGEFTQNGWPDYFAIEEHSGIVYVGAVGFNGLLEWRGGDDLNVLRFRRDADGSIAVASLPASVPVAGSMARTIDPDVELQSLGDGDTSGVTHMTFSSDGTKLAFFGGVYRGVDKQLRIFDRQSRRIATVPNKIAADGDWLQAMQFSPNGRLLLVSKRFTGYELFSLPDLRSIRLPRGTVGAALEADDLLSVALESGDAGYWHAPEGTGSQVAWLRQRFAAKSALVQGDAETQIPPPTVEDPARVTRVQAGLALLGYYDGPVDGVANDKLGAALRAFGKRNNQTFTGKVTELMEKAVDLVLPYAADDRDARGPNATKGLGEQLVLEQPLLDRARTELRKKGFLTRESTDVEVRVALVNYRIYYHKGDPLAPVTESEFGSTAPEYSVEPPIVTIVPGDDTRLAPSPELPSDELTIRVQRGLDSLGFYYGTIDGVFDQSTERAIRSFEVYFNYPVTGRLSEELLNDMIANGAIVEAP